LEHVDHILILQKPVEGKSQVHIQADALEDRTLRTGLDAHEAADLFFIDKWQWVDRFAMGILPFTVPLPRAFTAPSCSRIRDRSKR
jgi:hypothetical protein